MSTDLVISLPKEAVIVSNDALSLPVIPVTDDRTNIAAAENLKIVSKLLKEFREICEPVRVELRAPLDNFLSLKKVAEDKIEAWINDQKRAIGDYNQELMRLENEKLKAEQDKKNAELKAENDRLNELRRIEAEKAGEVAKEVVFEPVQEPIAIEQSKARSEFASATIKEKAKGVVTDKLKFIAALADGGHSGWVNLIFDKVNETQLNNFLKAMGINGRDNRFPGVAVEMIADVRVR